MKSSNKTDVYDKIRQFQQTTLSSTPEPKTMIDEVQLMNFKIRPIYGNITVLDFQNTDFISALWSLGKLDEFFRVESPLVPDEDRDTFFKLVDEIRANLQQRLNVSYMSRHNDQERPIFEIEIFKDITPLIN